MIRDLAKKLATFEEFADFVIIELEFRRGTFEPTAQVLKRHSAMVLLRASSAEEEVLVKMIRPRHEIKAALGSRIQSSEKVWRIFTAAEVLNFAEAVGDKNKIHRLNPPIVPGILILETICAEFPTCKALKLRFKNFVTAGEQLSLIGNGSNFEICSIGVRKVSIWKEEYLH